MSTDTEQDKPGRAASGCPALATVEIVVLVFIFLVVAGMAVPSVDPIHEPRPAAAVTALGEDLRADVARAHALWLAQGQPRFVDMDGRAVLLAFGYPTLVSVDAALGEVTGFAFDDRQGAFAWLDRQASTHADCAVRYAPPSTKGEAPRIAVVTAGC